MLVRRRPNDRSPDSNDIARARKVPSLQLTGTDERATLDLNALTGIGVKLIGRLAAYLDGEAPAA